MPDQLPAGQELDDAAHYAELAGLIEYMDQAAEVNERTAKQWEGTGSVEMFLKRNAEAWRRAASMARQYQHNAKR